MTVEEPGKLRLEGIELRCIIGVSRRERRDRRRLIVNVEIEVDFRRVAASDAIRDTVDYRRVARRVVALGDASSFRLIETLAGHLARALVREFPRVLTARVEVWKPEALDQGRTVGAVVAAARTGR